MKLKYEERSLESGGKKKLKKNAFDILQREAGEKERTYHLKFKDLSCQEYVKNFGDEQVRMIFKIKNNMINPEKEQCWKV